jgi:antagonist of KipI
MDPLALRVANLLVGNKEGEAALEATLAGPELEFRQDTLIAICGGDLRPTIGGVPVPAWRPVSIAKGSVLSFGNAVAGCRAYLAVAGGFKVPRILGGRGAYLQAGIGGLGGRALQAGDALKTRRRRGRGNAPTLLAVRPKSSLNSTRERHAPFLAASWFAGANLAPYSERPTVRVVRGSEFARLRPQSQEQLFAAEFQVTPQSDRMGYRLAGPRLDFAAPCELLSEAVAAGTIQVPPDGQPIVLMADCATTGGYAKVAHVATVDLPVMAQARPGTKIRFRLISIEEAQSLYRAREAAIGKLKVGLKLRYT